MSEELNLADANLHAERAALRLAAQTAGIVVWLDGDTYHASLNDAEATGATPGAALVALCVRLGEALDVTSAELAAADHCATVAQHALDATRADLDTLRNGVAWLGGELERVKAWAGLWKRAAKRSARDWRDLVAAYEDMRAENAAVRRAARQLVVAWRKERAATEDARKDARYFLSELEAFIPDAAARLAEIKQRWPRLWKITRAPEVEPPQNDADTE